MRHFANLGAFLMALLLASAVPASAQNADAGRFLVYPPNHIINFTGNDVFWFLHFDGRHEDKGRDKKFNAIYYHQTIQVMRFSTESEAVANCQGAKDVPIQGKTVRKIEGFPCAFIQEHASGSGDNATYYRSSWFALGNYFASLGEGAQPRSMLPPAPPVEPLLAALKGAQSPAQNVDDLKFTVQGPPAVTGTPSVRREGNSVYVTDEAGNQRVFMLLPDEKTDMPSLDLPTVGGEAKALERYLVTHMFEVSLGHVPPELRSEFMATVKMPSEVAGDVALTALEAGESAVNWAKNNPADAALLGLSVAVGLYLPGSSVVGGAMLAGTTSFVKSLMGNVFKDQSALQRLDAAMEASTFDAGSAMIGGIVGSAFGKVASQVFARAAVMTVEQGVGIATEVAVGKLGATSTIANVARKTALTYYNDLAEQQSRAPEGDGIHIYGKQ